MTNATSSYLNQPLRTLEQATLDQFESRGLITQLRPDLPNPQYELALGHTLRGLDAGWDVVCTQPAE